MAIQITPVIAIADSDQRAITRPSASNNGGFKAPPPCRTPRPAVARFDVIAGQLIRVVALAPQPPAMVCMQISSPVASRAIPGSSRGGYARVVSVIVNQVLCRYSICGMAHFMTNGELVDQIACVNKPFTVEASPTLVASGSFEPCPVIRHRHLLAPVMRSRQPFGSRQRRRSAGSR
jgi:hypothetical protein